MWTSFDTAREWVDSLPGYGLAFTISPREGYTDDPYVLVDYDDILDGVGVRRLEALPVARPARQAAIREEGRALAVVRALVVRVRVKTESRRRRRA